MSEYIQVFVNENDWFLGLHSGYQSNKYMYAKDHYLYLFISIYATFIFHYFQYEKQ